MRRLCGWESQSDIPSESTISRTFGDFAVDEIASSLFKDFVKKVARGRIVIHRSIDSTEIDARESAATRDEKAGAKEPPASPPPRRSASATDPAWSGSTGTSTMRTADARSGCADTPRCFST